MGAPPRYEVRLRRFMERVAVAGPDDCWLWRGKKSNGYGAVMVDGHMLGAHKFMFEHVFGEVPANREVCHQCDVKLCCNPRHLYAGTHAQNMADASERGLMRGLRGEQHPNARLTAAQVISIRDAYDAGVPRARLAESAGVSEATIGSITRNDAWVDPKRPTAPKGQRALLGERNHKAKLTEADVRAICQLYAAGATQLELAHRFGVTRGNVGFIVRRDIWRHVAIEGEPA